MDSTWPAILTFLAVFTLAILSPGPNFILVTNTALGESRRAGLLTALGVATGSGLYGIAGLGGLLVLVESLPYFGLLMRFVGGGYLVWIGFTMLRSGRRAGPDAASAMALPGRTPWWSYRTGLLTNLTNPKAWAFYLSLFTVVMSPDLPLWSKIFLAAAIFLISLTWYMTLAALISSRRFQPAFLARRSVFQAVLGVVLMMLGGRVLFF